jgi:hypothetical protein
MPLTAVSLERYPKVPFKKVSTQKKYQPSIGDLGHAKNCRDSTAISGGRERIHAIPPQTKT